MSKLCAVLLAAALATLTPANAQTAGAADDQVLDVGSDLQLFVDRQLIDSLVGLRLTLGQPRDEGAVLRFDRPWEGPFCGYATVLKDRERYLLYYRGLPVAGADGSDREVTCVAQSVDGLEWTRPELGLFEVDGSARNNVVLAHAAPVSHNFSPFLDARPGVEPAQRFKALGGNERSGLLAYGSPDGLRWTPLSSQPVLTGGQFDSQNVAFWSELEGCYVCYFRTWSGGGYSGIRTVSRSTSSDFETWSDPVAMRFGDAPLEHLYTNQTHPYFRAPKLYVAIAARFLPGRRVLSDSDARRLGVDPRYFHDCSDAVLMTSRGGDTYTRAFREAFLRPGVGLENWVSRSNYPALNIVPTGPAEMSVYVNQNYAQPTAELRRYSLRLDGLASISAPAAGGEWLSRPLEFSGERLVINFSTSAAGGMRFELQDLDGRALPGFTLEQCVEQIGNEIEREVSWTGGRLLASLAGKPLRLRCEMRDADLYSLRFAAPEQPSAARWARNQEAGLEPFLGEPTLDIQHIFDGERFPSIVVGRDGTVLATWGSSSVRVRRSEDGGVSWGDPIVIAQPGFQGGGTLVDESNGEVLAFVEAGHPPAELSVYRSADQGRSWQLMEVEILPNSLGHLPSMHMNDSGITLRHGEHAGRLLRPTRYYAGGNERERWPGHYTNAMYSDDGGRTWQASEPFPENGTGEATVAELSDGRVYYNSRVHWEQRPDNTRRRAAWSHDGGRTWRDWTLVRVLPDGTQNTSYGCMGGLVRLPIRGRDILIFSNLDTPNAQRERVSVWASFDGGVSWPVKRLVYGGPSAYSSLTAGRPDTPSAGWVYLQFEGGAEGGCQVARFNLAWLLDGMRTGDGDLPDWIER